MYFPLEFEPTEMEELTSVTKIFEEFIKEYYPESTNFFPILMDGTQNPQKIEQVDKSVNAEKSKIKIEDYLKKERAIKMTEIAETLSYLSEIARLPVLETKNRDYIAEKWKNLFEDKEMPHEIKSLLSGLSIFPSFVLKIRILL